MPLYRYPDIGGQISGHSRSWLLGCFLHHVPEFIQVGPPLPPPSDLDESRHLQLFDELADTRLAHPHVGGQSLLSGKTVIVVPGVVEKHRVCDFGTKTQARIFENEIRDLREASAHDGIVCREFDIAFSDDVADVTRLRRHSLIVARVKARELRLSPGLFTRCQRATVARDEWQRDEPANRRQRIQHSAKNEAQYFLNTRDEVVFGFCCRRSRLWAARLVRSLMMSPICRAC